MQGDKHSIGTRLNLAELSDKWHLNPLYVFVVVSALIAFGLLIIFMPFFTDVRFILIYIASLLIYLVLFKIYFDRNPTRNIIKNKNTLLSPADGLIVYIKKIDKNEIPFSMKGHKSINLGELVKFQDASTSNGYLIAIGMKLFDVHVNRSPIQGKVVYSKHNAGPFISMTKKEFEIENESHTTMIQHEGGCLVGIVQIATFLVRRIQCHVNKGDIVKQGERIGRITFGSQVDIAIFTDDIDILVKPGDRVYAGESTLARFKC